MLEQPVARKFSLKTCWTVIVIFVLNNDILFSHLVLIAVLHLIFNYMDYAELENLATSQKGAFQRSNNS
jgi:hypothetical protein